MSLLKIFLRGIFGFESSHHYSLSLAASLHKTSGVLQLLWGWNHIWREWRPGGHVRPGQLAAETKRRDPVCHHRKVWRDGRRQTAEAPNPKRGHRVERQPDPSRDGIVILVETQHYVHRPTQELDQKWQQECSITATEMKLSNSGRNIFGLSWDLSLSCASQGEPLSAETSISVHSRWRYKTKWHPLSWIKTIGVFCIIPIPQY